MQDGRKAVWSIPYVSLAFFPSLKQNFIAYGSFKVSLRPDCIFEIHQLWQSGFSRVYSSCCCSCSLEREIIKIGQSSHKMYSNNILNFQKSTPILNTYTKNSVNLLKAPRMYSKTCMFIDMWIYMRIRTYTHLYRDLFQKYQHFILKNIETEAGFTKIEMNSRWNKFSLKLQKVSSGL